MSKRVFTTILVAFALVLCTTFSFAANNLGDNIKDSMNKSGKAIENMGNDVKNAVVGAENTVEGMFNNNKDNDNNNNNMMSGIMNNNNNNGGYTATRTATTTNGTFLGMNATAWTWLILGIATIAIVALVWYYGKQYDNNKTRIDDGE